jgi:hypothetical protein
VLAPEAEAVVVAPSRSARSLPGRGRRAWPGAHRSAAADPPRGAPRRRPDRAGARQPPSPSAAGASSGCRRGGPGWIPKRGRCAGRARRPCTSSARRGSRRFRPSGSRRVACGQERPEVGLEGDLQRGCDEVIPAAVSALPAAAADVAWPGLGGAQRARAYALSSLMRATVLVSACGRHARSRSGSTPPRWRAHG